MSDHVNGSNPTTRSAVNFLSFLFKREECKEERDHIPLIDQCMRSRRKKEKKPREGRENARRVS